jgi:D-sedoheptulose 7-phosphate isomerase
MTSFQTTIDEHIQVIEQLRTLEADINKAAELIANTFKQGNKILLCGNGGSAADAQHIAAEFMVRYKAERIPLPAIALTTDTSILTAHANDYEFETVFSRQIMALAQKGDCLIAVSTSGNSKNIINAVISAKKNQCKTIALTGMTGGFLKSISDLCICVPSDITARTQESHILIGHFICESVDKKFTHD